MRFLITTIIAMTACLGFADIEVQRFKADFTTATQASNEVSSVIQSAGYLQQIDIIPSGTYTANVSVTYTPIEGTAIDIYTNAALTAQTILFPAVDKTGVDGAALTGDDPTRYILNGGTLTCTVSNVNKTAGTSAVILLKTEK